MIFFARITIICFCRERLFANDFISMKKVMEHVLEKMEEDNPQSTTGKFV